MANLLYRLGDASARRRWLVLAVWVAILAGVGIGAATLAQPTTSAITIPGTESQRAIELLASKFPGTGGASARIVVAAPAGHTLTETAYSSRAEKALADLARAPQVISVTGFSQATLSADKRIAYADVSYAVPVADVTQEAKDALEAIAAPAREAGLQVEFSGGVISTTQAHGASSEVYGIIIAYLVLVLTLGGLLVAGMPLVNALVGVGVGMLGIQVVTGFTELNSTAPALATMLGLAVGIDYALFIVSRHRQQVRDGMPVRESIATATATAGSAVVFAGVTVVIALCGLAVANIPFLTVMGLCAAATVTVTVVLAVTLIPAILSFSGGPGRSRIGFLNRRAEPKTHPFAERWARIVTARPWLTVLGCLVIVGAMAFPVLGMRLGLPSDGTKSTESTERRAYDLLAQGYGPGFNGPLTLVLSGPGRTDLKAVGDQVAPMLQTDPDVAVAVAASANQAGDVVILSVIPKSAPDSEATKDLVNRIRAAGAEVREETGITAYVTGTTAFNIDVSDKLSSALAPFLVLIVVLALILLLLVFRSILVPVKAALGFLLSLGASMGVVTLVFQEGHLGGLFGVEAPGPILSFLPVLVIGILFGLAMDYEVFLVSRVKEAYAHHGDARRAIIDGMRESGRVVTAAGLIMTAVFAAFIFGGDATIKAIGLALAVGVVIDAFLVRMTLVPAVLHLLGRSAWWLPAGLQRVLPNVDVEGTQLARPANGHAEPQAMRPAGEPEGDPADGPVGEVEAPSRR